MSLPQHAPWRDKGFDVEMPVAFYDATDPEAREFLWAKVKQNYYDKGIRTWWLDGCEPEIQPGHPQNLRFHAGPGAEGSGDIGPTWESLQAQVRAGLNVAVSGIPWWTTDIGGFHGGDPDSPEYRELMIRWFQYGVFCPLFRLHGFRDPRA